MVERMGLLGRKLGMTQIFGNDGECIPVTVVQTGPCVVTGKRTPKQHGYSALQIGFEDKPRRLSSRPEAGFFAKLGVAPQRLLRELRLPASVVDKYEVGQVVSASDVFAAGKAVDVLGQSKGKGFQGVMKRHKMAGTKASHGVHEFFRHGGSIGCRLTPGRVHKGKRMGGQMGTENMTIQNLEVVQVVPDTNCVLIRGSVPGSTNSYVLVKLAAKLDNYKKKGAGGEQERSKNPLKASKKAAAGR
jgi:large subunit ribosomal protein L3